jgi:hypothetical protein
VGIDNSWVGEGEGGEDCGKNCGYCEGEVEKDNKGREFSRGYNRQNFFHLLRLEYLNYRNLY